MVVQPKQYVDAQRGLVARDIFINPDIYQQELERIFSRMWLFISHTTLVPNPNDFLLSYMGEDPIILTRDSKGKVRAFLNMCMHRGNRIVRADKGNAKSFMCAYHGWTFGNDGKLVSVPGFQEAYYGELPIEKLGLVEVAKLDTYAGFIFATWDPEAPSLEAYLGDMRWYMDIMFNRREGGIELIGPDKWLIPCNWKNSADNFVGDMYHAVLSHRSATLAFARRRGMDAQPMAYNRPGNQVSPGNGHGGFAGIYPTEEEYWSRGAGFRDARMQDYLKETHPEVKRRLGANRAAHVGPEHSTVFPNMSWLPNGTIRMWHPRSPDRTEVWSFTFVDKEAPDWYKQTWRVQCLQSFGPSGLLEQDDMDNWGNSTVAGKSFTARKTPNMVVMGLGHVTHDHPDLPGRVAPKTFSENNQRGFYERWQEVMDARSWSEISVAPQRAKYEGTERYTS